MKARLLELGMVSLAALFLAGIVLRSTTVEYLEGRPLFEMPWDHHKYIYMASQPLGSFHIAPFCWRVLQPLLAQALPFSLQTSFLMIAFFATAGTGVALYYLARAAGFSRYYGMLAASLFYGNYYATKVPLSDFWLPDALSFTLTASAIALVLGRRDAWLAAVMALGVAVKESLIFVAPLLYTLHASRPIDLTLARRTLLVAAPAVAVLAGLRLAIPAFNDDPAYLAALGERYTQVQGGSSAYNPLDLFQDLFASRVLGFNFELLKSLTIFPFGFLLLVLPAFALPQSAALLIRLSPFLALTQAQILFAVNVERLVVLGFPAIILLALHGMAAVERRFGVHRAWLAAVPLYLVLWQMVPGSMGAPSWSQAWFAAVGLALLAAWLAYRALSRRPSPAG